MEPKAGFQLLDHTADLGIRAWGGDAAQALRYAILGLFSAMVSLDSVAARTSWEIRVTAPDPHLLFFNLMDELLYLHHTEGLLVSEVEELAVSAPAGAGPGRADEEWEARVRVRGEIFDADRHRLGTEIKAVTMHELVFRETSSGTWEAQMFLDL